MKLEEDFESYEFEPVASPTDPFEMEAVDVLGNFFNEHRDRVFYGRQLEVIYEDRFFHWVTNRAIRFLAERKIIKKETRVLAWGGNITLYWHRSFRYYKSEARILIDAVEGYSNDKVGSSTGRHCELLIVEGFAKFRYVLVGRTVNEYQGRKWEGTEHDLDMIVEKDGIGYGIEVKNTLGYMPKDEFDTKVQMCRFLGLKPVFAVRMLPKSWIYALIRDGGYAMILKHLLLPVECPKSLMDGTIKRFDNWHHKHVKLG